VKEILRRDGRILIISFADCRVQRGDQTLFEPSWGMYDMAVGSQIISVFAGPADPAAFGLKYLAPEEKTHKIQHDEQSLRLHSLYQSVRDYRGGATSAEVLEAIWQTLQQDYSEEWLLPLELYEATSNLAAKPAWFGAVRDFLEAKKSENEEVKDLIQNGLELIG
jgi:phenylalanine-4-hydroxylase